MFEVANNPEQLHIAMAGASGFVGTALRRVLRDRHEITGLTRSPNVAALASGTPGERWRHCDLFSLSSVTEAMEGADVGIYLVHSMLPSSRLSQGNFEDFDLILADNFARAAEQHGLRQIIYLGGLIPDEDESELSMHLRSRLEVERVLGSTGVPVTSLRAALIAGSGGSSLEMLVKLVGRLPAMGLPAWCQSRTQPISISDVIRAFEACLGNEESYGQVFDIGGPEVMTYRNMIEKTAATLGRRRFLIDVPVIPVWLSRGWVSMITGASSALAGPLTESLRHDMTVRDNPLQQHLAPQLESFDDALAKSLEPTGRPRPNPRDSVRDKDDAVIRVTSVARSVQRLALPPSRHAAWVAAEYMRWLPRFVWPFMKVVVIGRLVRFQVALLGLTLLQLRLEPEESADDRQLFTVTGGALAKPSEVHPGRLEFREILDDRTVMAAVHDFAPRLPWFVYNLSQAIVHLWVMRGFGRHLLRESRRETRDGLTEDSIAE